VLAAFFMPANQLPAPQHASRGRLIFGIPAAIASL
jgi:hypothetical protein